uniref:Macro domain-containing protein n=1 Tax=Haptolina ericina TaxID=156174 RepID=A0A7S3C5B1_9EUKA
MDDVGVQRVGSFPGVWGRITVAAGSVIDFSGSAIVNAANEGCISGGGVDGAVNAAGGEELVQARRALPIVQEPRVRCPTGQARTTTGGKLRVAWVIHAVGPNYRAVESEDDGDDLLFRAYCSAMIEARAKAMRTVGFSLLSAGIFRGGRPLSEVLTLALLAVEACVYPELEEVFLVGFTRNEIDTLHQVSESLLTPPNATELRQSALERFCAPVRQYHAWCLEQRQRPIGHAIALAAAVVQRG